MHIIKTIFFFLSPSLSPNLGIPCTKKHNTYCNYQLGILFSERQTLLYKKNTGSAQFSFHLSKSLRLHHQRVQVDDEDTAHAATPQRIERYRQQLRWS